MAGPTRASGYTSHSGNFIPEVWSGKMVDAFYAASVFSEITSTDYEGEIVSFGDTIQIRTVPNMTVADYEVGGTLTYQNPTSTKVELNINKAKSFSIAVDSVDKYQSDLPMMEKWAEAASETMKVQIDTTVLSELSGDAVAANKGTTAGAISGNLDLGVTGTAEAITSSNAIDYILRHGQALDEQNVPETGRFIVIPAAMGRMLKSSDLKDASIMGDSKSVLRNGRLGTIDRFTVYTSNNLPVTSGETTVFAGHPSCLAFASQITENDTLPNPDSFGQLIRGLQVFGYKTVKPEGLTEGIITA